MSHVKIQYGFAVDDLRTEETRQVEEGLRDHFDTVECYRHNSVSMRLLIVDPQFAGLDQVQRFDIVEPFLDQFPEQIQQDLFNVLILAPGEEDSVRYGLRYREFVDRANSRL